MKSKSTHLIPALVLFASSVLLFAAAVAYFSGQIVPVLYPVGSFLASIFSYALFLIPLLLIFCGASLISGKVSAKEGLLLTALFLLPLLLAALLLQLLAGPVEGSLYSAIREAILRGHGTSSYILYLSALFAGMLLSLLPPIRLIVIKIEENSDEAGEPQQAETGVPHQTTNNSYSASNLETAASEPEKRLGAAGAESILDAFPNVKRLYDTVKREEAAGTNPEPSESMQHLELPERPVENEEQADDFSSEVSDPATSEPIAGLEKSYPEAETAGDLARARGLEEFVESEEALLEEAEAEEEDESIALPMQSYEGVDVIEYDDEPDEEDSFTLLEEADVLEAEEDSAAFVRSTGKPELMPDIDPGLKFLEEGFQEDQSEEVELPEAEYEDDSDEDFDDDRVLTSASSGNREENDPTALTVNLDPGRPAEVSARAARRQAVKYDVPVESILTEYGDTGSWQVDEETRKNGEVLQETLSEFNIQAEVTGIRKGPVITMFEILPAPGVKLSKIVNLADNIALRLAASRVRIVAPIPGKHAVGIEIPNKKRALVSFREMVEDEKFTDDGVAIPMVLGKDITGNARIIDLAQTPHLLIAGATGSGKSVCVNSLITSVLYRRRPDEVKLLLIDPKIVELKLYNDVPHLLTPVITEPKKAFQALQYCLSEMERRYALLDSVGCRDIKSFNKKVESKKLATEKLPYIVVIVDEFADLMATTGKELESTLARLAAMSRAVGIHLVLATQRPSIDVITGIIKANIPSRIAFMVASKFDSRIIVDAVGAEKLLGKGDMLFSSAWDPVPMRIQGAFLSDEEVENVVSHVKTLGEPDYIDDEIFIEDEDGNLSLFSGGLEDPLMNKALEVVMMTGKASASYLQRRLKIGYNRAARLVEEMEDRGIVGPQNGSKPREILVSPEQVGVE